MRKRKSNHLIRTVLILICLQFTVTAIVSVSQGIDKTPTCASYTAQKVSSPITISSLFEKTEKNEEDNKAIAEEFQNTFDYFFFDITPAQTVLRTDVISFHLKQPPLFGLHCVYRI